MIKKLVKLLIHICASIVMACSYLPVGAAEEDEGTSEVLKAAVEDVIGGGRRHSSDDEESEETEEPEEPEENEETDESEEDGNSETEESDESTEESTETDGAGDNADAAEAADDSETTSSDSSISSELKSIKSELAKIKDQMNGRSSRSKSSANHSKSRKATRGAGKNAKRKNKGSRGSYKSGDKNIGLQTVKTVGPSKMRNRYLNAKMETADTRGAIQSSINSPRAAQYFSNDSFSKYGSKYSTKKYSFDAVKNDSKYPMEFKKKEPLQEPEKELKKGKNTKDDANIDEETSEKKPKKSKKKKGKKSKKEKKSNKYFEHKPCCKKS